MASLPTVHTLGTAEWGMHSYPTFGAGIYIGSQCGDSDGGVRTGMSGLLPPMFLDVSEV